MRTVFALLFILVLSTSLQATELNWLTDYGTAIKLARSTQRPMLLIISRGNPFPGRSAPGPADPTPFPAQDVLESYVLCQVDADSNHGQRVAEAFQVTEYPHSVIIDKTTKKILYRKVGTFTEESWSTILTKYQQDEPVVEVVAPRQQVHVGPQARGSATPFYFRRPAFCNT